MLENPANYIFSILVVLFTSNCSNFKFIKTLFIDRQNYLKVAAKILQRIK
jgi:hypothetical protein